MSAGALEIDRISKRYGRNTVLDAVSITFRPGRVHTLMGQNGAGKSTLLKIISGDVRPDGGVMRIDGVPIQLDSPSSAIEHGIGCVYQEVGLLPHLTVAENICMGRFPGRLGFVSHGKSRQAAMQALSALELQIDPEARVGDLSIAEQQMILIARVVSTKAAYIILDEPTSSLDRSEVGKLFAAIRRLTSMQVGVIFVSHYLDQVFEISDEISVLKDGCYLGTWRAPELTSAQLVSMMIGRQAAEPAVRAVRCEVAGAQTQLRIEALAAAKLEREVSLTAASGEIIGIGGLLGSGRTELGRVIAAVDPQIAGAVELSGIRRNYRNPADAIANGIVYLPENRKADGIFRGMSVADNLLIALRTRLGWLRRRSRRDEAELLGDSIRRLKIKVPDSDGAIAHLSGGNQQKVILARLLALRPKVLVLDEPTRGVDVAAKSEIEQAVIEAAAQGAVVFYIASDIDELVRVSDRVIIMRNRRVWSEIPRGMVARERVLHELGKDGIDQGSAES